MRQTAFHTDEQLNWMFFDFLCVYLYYALAIRGSYFNICALGVQHNATESETEKKSSCLHLPLAPSGILQTN